VSPLELVVRQCQISVEEIYGAKGRIVGTIARATIDRLRGSSVYEPEVLCAAKCEPPVATPEQLGELLQRLGVLIGTRALHDELLHQECFIRSHQE